MNHERGHSKFEKYVLKRAHPRRIIIDSIGWVWIVYFIWNQSWEFALATLFAMSIVAYFLLRNVDGDKMAETALGKMALLHLHPANFIIQLVTLIITIWALWAHSTYGILIGFSLLVLGHLFGWERVNKCF